MTLKYVSYSNNLIFPKHIECKLMTLYSSSPHLLSYRLEHQDGDRITTSSVLFDHKICFNSHISAIIKKAKGL